MTDFTFTDRASWIAFRADWRARYKEATATIRATKGEIAGHRRLRRELGEAGERHRYAADGMQWRLRRERDAARYLMERLDAAKERKAEMMAAKTDETPLAA